MTEQSPGDGEAVAHLSDGTHHRGVFGLDGLAISASTLCLIHCLFLPIAIAFLPSLADWADWGRRFTSSCWRSPFRSAEGHCLVAGGGTAPWRPC